MAYYLTEDEKYINGVTYAAGEIDVADNWVDVLAGSAGTLAENTTAYGELTYANRNLATFADVDIYDLGVLSYGTYNISVDKHWWDYSATNIGYVNSFELLDSSGDSLKFQLLDTQDIVFSVAAPDTYYVKVKGSYSDTQYALSYTKTSNTLDANIAAIYSNVHINGTQAVGEFLTATESPLVS